MNARDRQWLLELAEKHPTPFWVLLPRSAQARYFELSDAFRPIARTLQVFYSVKTNPHPHILSSLDGMESGFECVSLRELDSVASFSRPKIFNSCAPSDDEIRSALHQKAWIVVDSLSMAEKVSRLAESKPLKVGIRVRLDTHRFGFAPSELGPAMASLEKLGLSPVLLHAHPGTNCSLSQYRSFISSVSSLCVDFPSFEVLDLGGGFPGKTGLLERKNRVEDYAAIVREQLGDFLQSRTLFLESGRFLCEDAMILITRVRSIKHVEGRPFALLDAGINLLPRIAMSPFRFFPLSESGSRSHVFRLGGPLMFGSDELGQLSGKLGEGDFLAVENCGAYCTELAWRLSMDIPRILSID
ncbi:MAG: alanine racemase [archaeon]